MAIDDEGLYRILGYNRRRYWLTNGWCIRFRVKPMVVSPGRPHGISYSLTLHDVDMTRLYGIDNAHGVPLRCQFDHKHRFRRPEELVPYHFQDADTLIADFFADLAIIFDREGTEFAYDDHEIELEVEDDEEVAE